MTTATESTRRLTDRHRAELHASGLSDETIEVAGIYTADSAEIKRILGWAPKGVDWGQGLVFPFHFPDEPDTSYSRVKLDFPRDRDGKPVKYESPRAVGNRPYFPVGFFDALNGAKTTIFTEGEKKALSVTQTGTPCIGLIGVWGWQDKRLRSDTGRAYGERHLIPALARIDWKGRDTIIIFDSDAATKSEVRLAEARLADSLTKAGANVRIGRLPATGQDKVGVDDFLVAHGDDGPARLREVVTAAQEPETPDNPAPMDWARIFVEGLFTEPQGRTLQWWRDEFLRWDGKRYLRVPDSELSAIVLEWLDQRQRGTKPRHAADSAHHAQTLPVPA